MRMKLHFRNLLSLLFVMMTMTNVWADELPYLTTDIENPVLYRIKNTRRTAKGTANYWTMPNGLTTKQDEAVEVYFTGVKGNEYMRVKIHPKEGEGTLTADYTWGEGIDWYIKEFKSAQGGDYSGVLISNAITFPNVYNDAMAADGLGCWYVGSSNTAPWLYGGQWDGSIFTMELTNGDKFGDSLVEIPLAQGKEISDGASRADMVAGDGYTTFTTKSDICVIVKTYDVNVKDCDYILFKFAEPIPSGIRVAFWKQGGTDNKELTEGITEYKYVFKDDSKCAIKDDILPQLTLLTINAGVKTVKIEGIYKHCNGIPQQEADPLVDAIEQLTKLIEKAKIYTIGTQLGQYSGTDITPIAKAAEEYLVATEQSAEQVYQYINDLNKGMASLSINLPAEGAEFRLYCPALKSYVSAPSGASRLKMVAEADETTVFTYDGKNIIGKASGLYTSTYELKAQEGNDYVFIIPAYGSNPGLYTIEYTGGEKERCLQAEAAGTDCNRHYLSSQSGYSADTQSATAFEIQLVSGNILTPQNMTEKIANSSFETGNMDGWVYTSISGADADAKPNSNSTYKCTGTDGDYLFNTWVSSDSRLGDTQDHCAYQTLPGMPEGEYRLEVLASTNQSTQMDLFANHFIQKIVPRAKDVLTEHRLGRIFVTPENRSLTIGLRSASWFRCDRFVLTYLGKTKAYEEYQKEGYAEASIMNPVWFDNFDGRTTEGFTYEAAEGAKGSFSTAGGKQGDYTQVDRSVLQAWTDKATALGNATISTSYTNLPSGYYKVSANVRVIDEYGTVNKPIVGLTMFANDSKNAITKGNTPSVGDNRSKTITNSYAVITKVEDGNLKTGFQIEKCSFNWLGWQDFRLEFIGTSDPSEEIFNLNLPADQYVALCLPYDIKPEYFGPIYKVVDVTEGKALLVPNYDSTVPAGTPTVVKATGKNPEISIGDIQIDNGNPSSILTYWNNTLLVGSYDGYTWSADLADRSVYEADELEFEELDINHIDASITQMNRAAQRFWSENANYTTSSSSTITSYLKEPTINRRDQPNPIIIPCQPSTKTRRLYYNTDSKLASGNKNVVIAAKADKAEIYNLIPGLTYYYYIGTAAAKEQEGQFTVDGDLRMLYIGDNVYNVRDLGGKETEDARYVRYGKIYRSGELNGGYKATTDEISTMKKLGVGCEIDLRGELDNSGAGTSAYGFKKGTTFYYVGGDHYIADEATKLANGDAEAIKYWKEELDFAITNLVAGKGLNFHCRIGADRTGCLGLLLEGLLGVQENDLIRDYETTSFSTAAGTRIKHNTFDTGLKFIKNMIPSGGTLRDAFDLYATGTLGVSQEMIEQYREVMLLDEPEAVAIKDIIMTTQPTTEGIYDLTGRKLDKVQPGIMIVNGKKLLVK